MSISLSQPEPRLYSPIGEAVHVLACAGVTKWFFGDTYSIKLTSQLTNGSLGLIEASVPPGGGPVAHTRAHEDEIWYLISGELEGVVASFESKIRQAQSMRHRCRSLARSSSIVDRGGTVAQDLRY